MGYVSLFYCHTASKHAHGFPLFASVCFPWPLGFHIVTDTLALD